MIQDSFRVRRLRRERFNAPPGEIIHALDSLPSRSLVLHSCLDLRLAAYAQQPGLSPGSWEETTSADLDGDGIPQDARVPARPALFPEDLVRQRRGHQRARRQPQPSRAPAAGPAAVPRPAAPAVALPHRHELYVVVPRRWRRRDRRDDLGLPPGRRRAFCDHSEARSVLRSRLQHGLDRDVGAR